MKHYLLICRSITHAQRMNALLKSAGVSGRIYRPPVMLNQKGCSYAVRIGTNAFSEVIDLLRAERMLPERIFYGDEDGYREIMLQGMY